MTAVRSDFVASFAAALTQAGLPRMPSRVLSALLVAPAGGLSARELGDSLGISAGAVSGATRYLTRTSLVTRSRRSGERVDRFDVRDATWAEAMLVETQTLASLAGHLDDGLTGLDDPAAIARLAQTRDFFRFLQAELPVLVQRWRSESETV